MDALRGLAHPDFQDFYPQSGELTVGVDNLVALLTAYPGELELLGRDRILGGEERYVRTPIFTVIRVEGEGDTFTSISRARYPDGSTWMIIVVGEIRDGLVYRTESYFAPYFEPAAWRSELVELRPRPGDGGSGAG
ncbi:MAG TPA: hypothetical protein VFM19_08880 [Candidatus Limnocylindria bacterium]|nr:hypothetical protein [Candidatus Limnocylindria bacterium]